MSAADIADLAAACEAIGAGTVSAARVRRLAGTRDGLRLESLDSDTAALAAAASAAQEALDTAASATGVLAQAWRGGTGSAATDFLRRQCASGSTVIEQLTAAADTLRRLREELTRQVEAQDAATARIQTPAPWLSAARAVTSGRAGTEAVATVAGQIAPFLDTVLAVQWAPAVESATAGMSAAYRQATTELADREPVRFDTPAIPTAAHSTQAAPSASPAASAAPAPAGFSAPSIPSIPAVPDVGGAVGDLGGALLPLVTAIAAVLGGHSGSPAVGADTPSLAPGTTGPAPAPSAKAEPEPVFTPKTTPSAPLAKPGPAPGASVAAPLAPPLAAEAPSPPVSQGVHAAPAEPERTPCEIAADELPQVGG